MTKQIKLYRIELEQDVTPHNNIYEYGYSEVDALTQYLEKYKNIFLNVKCVTKAKKEDLLDASKGSRL